MKKQQLITPILLASLLIAPLASNADFNQNGFAPNPYAATAAPAAPAPGVAQNSVSRYRDSQDDSAIVNALTSMGDKIVAAIKAAMTVMIDMAYEFDPNLVKIIEMNRGSQDANDSVNEMAGQYTQQTVDIQTAAVNAQINNQKLPNFTSQLASLDGKDQPVALEPGALNILSGTVTQDNNQLSQDTYLNLNNLLGKLSYKVPQTTTMTYEQCTLKNGMIENGSASQLLKNIPGMQGLAKEAKINCTYSPDASDSLNFIRFVTSQNRDLTVGLNLAKLNGKSQGTLDTLKQDVRWQNYLVYVRSMIARNSVSIDNLNYLMTERLPQKGLGAKVGIPNNQTVNQDSNQSASPLEAAQYQATHRSNDPAWYQSVATASPATVGRETLIMLAEIEKQLFEMRQLDERKIATLSVMSLQSSQFDLMNMKSLQDSANNAIDQALNITQKPAADTTQSIPQQKMVTPDTPVDATIEKMKANPK